MNTQQELFAAEQQIQCCHKQADLRAEQSRAERLARLGRGPAWYIVMFRRIRVRATHRHAEVVEPVAGAAVTGTIV